MLSLQVAAPDPKAVGHGPSVLENQPEVQAAQAVGDTRNPSAS